MQSENVVEEFDKFATERHELRLLLTIYIIVGLIGGYVGLTISEARSDSIKSLAELPDEIQILLYAILFGAIVIAIISVGLIIRSLLKSRKYLQATEKALGDLWHRVSNVKEMNLSPHSHLVIPSDTWFKLTDSHYDDVYLGLSAGGGLTFVFQNSKDLPHVVVLPKSSVKPESLRLLGAKEAQELEGNFSNNYSVFYPEEANIEALSIMSPDNMQQLLEISDDISLETVDNIFVLQTDETKTSPELLQSFVVAGESTLSEFDREMQLSVDEFGSRYIKAINTGRVVNDFFRSIIRVMNGVYANVLDSNEQRGALADVGLLLLTAGMMLWVPFYFGTEIAKIVNYFL